MLKRVILYSINCIYQLAIRPYGRFGNRDYYIIEIGKAYIIFRSIRHLFDYYLCVII